MADVSTLIPPSMQAYLEHPDIKMAVDKLVDVDLDYIPTAVSWEEYSDYLNAKAMADLTRIEFTVGLKNLWSFIWKKQIKGHWDLTPIDAMKRRQDITIRAMWEEGNITIRHDCGIFSLYTAVQVTPDALTLAFAMETDDDFIAKGETSGFVWIEDAKHEWREWNIARLVGNIYLERELLKTSQERAQIALNWCDDYLSSKGLI